MKIAKLLVPVEASVVSAFIGLRLSEDIESFKSTAERYSKSVDALMQRRFVLHDEIGRKMNNMFTYYMYIGKWKELSPEDIIKEKRDVDEIIFTYELFFREIHSYLSGP